LPLLAPHDEPKKLEATAPTQAPTKTDGDQDRVFDDLEKRLSGKSSDAKVPVIVTLDASATAERVRGLERAVGAFSVK